MKLQSSTTRRAAGDLEKLAVADRKVPVMMQGQEHAIPYLEGRECSREAPMLQGPFQFTLLSGRLKVELRDVPSMLGSPQRGADHVTAKPGRERIWIAQRAEPPPG